MWYIMYTLTTSTYNFLTIECGIEPSPRQLMFTADYYVCRRFTHDYRNHNNQLCIYIPMPIRYFMDFSFVNAMETIVHKSIKV